MSLLEHLSPTAVCDHLTEQVKISAWHVLPVGGSLQVEIREPHAHCVDDETAPGNTDLIRRRRKNLKT